MKIIIAGGRDFNDYEMLCQVVDEQINLIMHAETTIVSGGARGADKLGECYAKEHGYALVVFEAEWEKYGKQAGYLRNAQMAEYADALIAFWNGESKGTGHMIDLAEKHDLIKWVYPY